MWPCFPPVSGPSRACLLTGQRNYYNPDFITEEGRTLYWMADTLHLALYDDIDAWELYDLETDPAEMHNLYGVEGYEEIITELHNELERLQMQYDDPIRF